MIPPRAITLLIIIFLLWSFPESQQPYAGGRPLLEYAIESEISALDVLNSTRYNELHPDAEKWLNLTGFREQDGLIWGQLPRVQQRVREQIEDALGKEEGPKVIHGLSDAHLAVYKNITGYVRGRWIRSSLENPDTPRPSPNLTNLLPDRDPLFAPQQVFHRNISGSEGNIHLRFEEKKEPSIVNGKHIQTLRADLAISDDNSAGEGWEMILHGLHFVDEGHILLTTSSDKFQGIFGLPHFAVTEYLFSQSQQSLNKSLSDTIERQQARKLFTLNPWDSTLEGHDSVFAAPNCEFIIYLQQYPLTTPLANGAPNRVDPALIGPMESELRFPQGHRAFEPPDLKMSMLIFSPDCGFMVESKGPPLVGPGSADHLKGRKTEVYASVGREHTLLYSIVLIAQVLLTIRQMKDSSTPSTRSRISFYTVSLLTLGDGFTGMAFLPLGMMYDVAFPTLLAIAFICFLTVTFFDLRFMMDIWSVQSQERRRQERAQQQSANAANQTSNSNENSNSPTPPPNPSTPTIPGSLPLPVTANRPTVTTTDTGAAPLPFILPSDQDATPAPTATQPTEASTMRRDLSSIYGKYYITLLLIVFLSLHASSWYPLPRTLYANALALTYLSFWIPQIHRNVMRNCRKALLWKYVLGQSALRLIPVAYFWGYDGNVLFTKPDLRMLAVLVGWVWCQIVVLVVQDLVGPRLFVPMSWVPPAYDYHPVLREDEESAKMPIGFATASAAADEIRSPTATSGSPGRGKTEAKDKDKDKGKRIFDCAICMQSIEVPVIPAGGGGSVEGGLAANWLARRQYMVTPCRHIFHTPCLEASMRYRLSCPICRETLPPL